MTHNYYKPNTYLTNTNYTLDLTQHTQHTRWDTKAAVASLKRAAKPGAPSARLGNSSWLALLGHLPSRSIAFSSWSRSCMFDGRVDMWVKGRRRQWGTYLIWLATPWQRLIYRFLQAEPVKPVNVVTSCQTCHPHDLHGAHAVHLSAARFAGPNQCARFLRCRNMPEQRQRTTKR